MMFRVHIIVANFFQNSINDKQIERLATFFRSALNFFDQLTGIVILYKFLKQDSFTISSLLHKQDLKGMIFFLMFYFCVCTYFQNRITASKIITSFVFSNMMVMTSHLFRCNLRHPSYLLVH